VEKEFDLMGKMLRVCELVTLKLRKEFYLAFMMEMKGKEDNRKDHQTCRCDNQQRPLHFFGLYQSVTLNCEFHPACREN